MPAHACYSACIAFNVEPIMILSFFFILRILLAWLISWVLLVLILRSTMWGLDALSGDVFVSLGAVLGALVITSTFSHLRRVRLIAGAVNVATVSNRQRRQIVIPFEAGEAFDLLDAAIRELPGAMEVSSARDSLQVRAKLTRQDPYMRQGMVQSLLARYLPGRRNQILATVAPNGESGSVTLICEPESAAWTDWYLVDDGTNLENAEAIGRAITRRVAQRRRNEQAAAAQSATEKELTVAKLNLLHAQVEPHFLYNTLASAQLLTRSDPARADAMLGNLITYLRNSLPRTEDSLSTLGEELEQARAYLDILKIRMGSRLNLCVEVPDAFLDEPFPRMMLQTLVENAIKHGLEPKSGGGSVWILARAAGPSLTLTVADDGRGFSAEGGCTGIGLRNVRERLRLAYGTTASFAIVANFPCGVAATITVPTRAVAGGNHVSR